MARRFPLYRDHKDVTCWNCDSSLGENHPFRDNDNPHGQWMKICFMCRVMSFYKIAKKGEEIW